MKNVRKSLMNLALGELAAACVFLVVYFMYLNVGTASMLALLFLVFILLQGVLYWMCRAIVLKTEKLLLLRKPLVVLRVLNVILAGAVIVYMIIFAENIKDMVVSALIFTFSAIEYINYYWYRLSYGKSGFHVIRLVQTGLRPSSMHKLMKRHEVRNKEEKR